MKFRNRLDVPLDFQLDGIRYQVEVGGTCDIPDRVAYAVAHSGLPLDQVQAVKGAPDAKTPRDAPTEPDRPKSEPPPKPRSRLEDPDPDAGQFGPSSFTEPEDRRPKPLKK